MIRITVDICPGGDKSRTRTVGEATIGNVGGDDIDGVYNGTMTMDGKPYLAVLAFRHHRPDQVWALVARFLKAAGLPTNG